MRSSRGKVRLLLRDELPADWNPTQTRGSQHGRSSHLIRTLENGGEGAAAALVAKLAARRRSHANSLPPLHDLRAKKRAAEALAYNGLVLSWPEITRLARGVESRVPNKLRCLKGKRNNLWPLPRPRRQGEGAHMVCS